MSGVGCFDSNDVNEVIFPALRNWAQNDIEPTSLIGTRPDDGRTRLCVPISKWQFLMKSVAI